MQAMIFDGPGRPLRVAEAATPTPGLEQVLLRVHACGICRTDLHILSDIPSFPYDILWGERAIKSVANLTRRDGEAFLALAPKVPVHTEVHPFPLVEANEALDALRRGLFHGAAALVVEGAADVEQK